jgi:hypothetical protein
MAIGFFDGNKADASPESIKRKRAMIAKMMASSRAPRNIGEGLNSIGDSIASSILGYQADKAERANEAERASIMGGINFGGAPVAAVGGPPVASGPSTPAVTPTAGTGILSFANQGATRNMPIVDELQSNIQTAVSTVYGPNYRAQVYSGGQPGIGSGGKRVGSTRHDHGNAADVYIIDPQGKRVTGDKLALLGRHWLQNGKGGVGMEMKGGGIHLDVHKNRAPIWTYGAVSPAQAALVKEFGGRPPRIIQTASAGPQANDAQMQDGAGELQAGGSEMMGGGYNPFLPRDMAPTADAMGQGIADNEEQTRIMEAQMAAEQGVPYAGNEPGQFNSMFSPDLMGGGLNPFVPRDMVQPEDAIAQAPVPMLPQMDRATFDAITGQMPPAPNMDRRNFDQITNTGAPLNPAFTGQQAGLAPSWGIGDPNAPPPSAQEVSGPAPGPFPTPPRRPANLGPQSPFVPQAMRQPIAPMEASENGAGAMQFIESEFARREGRPDPRTAMGAPGQIYNPFVQQPTQAPQMPAGGGSMPMGGAPAAQAQARPQGGMITPEQFRAAMTSRFTTDADKRLVLDAWNQQQARAQAEADRARVEAQNRQTAEALNIDPRLGGVAPTNDQKDLAQANKQRREAGLPILRMDEYKLQKARAGAASVSVDASQKAQDAFGVETSKALAKRFDEMVGDGDVAAQNLELVTELRRLGGRIDFGAPAVAKGLLGRFGIKTDGISDIEAFNTLINRLTPQQRLPGSGATSDFDAKMFKESLPQLMNTPEGNKLIIDTIEKVSQNRMARGEIAMRVQMGELDRKDGIAELRRLQAEARSMSDVVRDFGKKKPPPNAAPGTTSAPPPSQQGQPSQAEIEAEMKRRGLR